MLNLKTVISKIVTEMAQFPDIQGKVGKAAFNQEAAQYRLFYGDVKLPPFPFTPYEKERFVDIEVSTAQGELSHVNVAFGKDISVEQPILIDCLRYEFDDTDMNDASNIAADIYHYIMSGEIPATNVLLH